MSRSVSFYCLVTKTNSVVFVVFFFTLLCQTFQRAAWFGCLDYWLVVKLSDVVLNDEWLIIWWSSWPSRSRVQNEEVKRLATRQFFKSEKWNINGHKIPISNAGYSYLTTRQLASSRTDEHNFRLQQSNETNRKMAQARLSGQDMQLW